MCRVYFLIGTVAELIKIAPVVAELNNRKIDYEIISSGQNDLSNIALYKGFIKPPTLILNAQPKHKTPLSLLTWFMATFLMGIPKIFRHTGNRASRSKKIMLVHGDTITTLMGAILGKIAGMKVGHIEAGLRSGNLLDPFPEEIDRVLTSYFANYHFCPGEWAANNLKGRSGLIINTQFNTNIESLSIGLQNSGDQTQIPLIDEKDFFIFIMHRQENLINADLVRTILNVVANESAKRKCLFIIHDPTRHKLKELGLSELVFSNPNIHTTERLSHENFIKVLKKCSFIMTDGGGNQEECYYLGVPCLLLRKVSERLEGLGENAFLSHNNPEKIKYFIENFPSFLRPAIAFEKSPSEIIVDTLSSFLNSGK